MRPMLRVLPLCAILLSMSCGPSFAQIDVVGASYVALAGVNCGDAALIPPGQQTGIVARMCNNRFDCEFQPNPSTLGHPTSCPKAFFVQYICRNSAPSLLRTVYARYIQANPPSTVNEREAANGTVTLVCPRNPTAPRPDCRNEAECSRE